jgi:flagellar biosynthesis/type III secretory pathway protein FliH
MNAYEASLKQQRDWNSALAYAEMKGREEGHELGLEKGLELGREEGLEKGREEALEKVKKAIDLR